MAGNMMFRTPGPAGQLPSTVKARESVATVADEATVAGIHVKVTVGDGGATVVERAARGGDTVDRVEFCGGVEVPHDGAVFLRVGAKVAVHRSREKNAGIALIACESPAMQRCVPQEQTAFGGGCAT